MEWRWEIARFGNCGERNLWIGREVNTGRIVELLLAPDLLPGYVVNASGDAAAERARIRRELREWLEDNRLDKQEVATSSCLMWVRPGDLLDILDRICPEGE